VSLAGGGDRAATATSTDAAKVLSLSFEERRLAVAGLSLDERRALVEALPPLDLLALAKRNAAALGTYSATLARRERVGGRLTERQTTKIWVQPEPFAVLMFVTGGPAKGRRILYNAALRHRELRAREPGLLGRLGAIWVDIDSPLTRGDSNHPIVEIGFSALISLLERNAREALAEGPFARAFTGFEGDAVCQRFDSPKTSKRLYATSSLICLDLLLGLPVHTEVTDSSGPLEMYWYGDVEPNLSLAGGFFTPAGAGL
jgi:hypothetical protein